MIRARRVIGVVDGDYVEKITCIKEISSYTVHEFHTF
jgi:hypothetical protein